MKNSVLVIAPHADDETLGCGGTILRHRYNGDEVHWALITEILNKKEIGNTSSVMRREEIHKLTSHLKFNSVHRLGFEATALDEVGLGMIIHKLREVFIQTQANIVYVPFPGDIHTDHKRVFDAAVACSKWFRQDTVHSVRIYETLSETNFCINANTSIFHPNLYVNISEFLDLKISALNIFTGEMGDHPFPRSEEAVRALATLRGSESGFFAAEAFMILKQIEK